MKIAIVGSRTLPKEWVLPRLNFLLNEKETQVISGGASGVDTFVKMFCDSWKIPIEIIRPINSSDKISYLFRNIEILTKADKVVAFWDGNSRGTKFVIDYCKARNKPLEIIIRN
jgi:hypothetical protein